MSYFDKRHLPQLISASLAGTSFIGFTQIVSRGGELPWQLHYAIMFFAVGIPLLAAFATCRISTPKQIDRAERLFPFVYFVWVLPVVGIGLMFASYGGDCVLAYGLGVVAAFVLAAKISGKPGEEP